jgi:hypothetical protein
METPGRATKPRSASKQPGTPDKVKTVPRIIDDVTWGRVQERLAREADVKNNEVLREELRRALMHSPMLVSRDLVGVGCAHSRTYTTRFGSWAAAVREAGGDPSALASAVDQRARERKRIFAFSGAPLPMRCVGND